MRTITNTIIVVDVNIGLVHKSNMTIIYVATHLNQRLFAQERRQLVL